MKVEVLINLGSSDYPEHPYLAGETHEVPDAVGGKFVANGHARALPEEAAPEEVKAQLIAPEQPAVAEPETVAVSHESKQEKPAKAALKSSKEK